MSYLDQDGFVDDTSSSSTEPRMSRSSSKNAELTWENLWNARVTKDYETRHVIYFLLLGYLTYKIIMYVRFNVKN